jgi:hypothetical protein
MVQEIGSQQDTDKHLLDILSVGAVVPIITYNVWQLTDSFCFSQKFWLGAVIRCIIFF